MDLFNLLNKWSIKLSEINLGSLRALIIILFVFLKYLFAPLIIILVSLNIMLVLNWQWIFLQLFGTLILFLISFYGLLFLSFTIKYARDDIADKIKTEIISYQNSKFLLYLRPFSYDRQGVERNSEKPWWFISSNLYEAKLTFLIEKYCPVLGVMRDPSTYDGYPNLITAHGHYNSFGAGRLIFNDEDWKENISIFIKSSTAILIVLFSSSGILWELEFILKMKIFNKCVFIIYPKNDEYYSRDSWNKTSISLNHFGISVPPFHKKGWIFTIGDDGQIKHKVHFPNKHFIIGNNKVKKIINDIL